MSVFVEKVNDDGREISIETGKWAKQSDGAIVYRCDKLVLLATVCATKEAKPEQSFFPLTVDYREKFYASGRIPGGYFKRESRPAEHETLMSRLIDRPCRPLFPEGYFCEVQLLVTVLSHDPSVAIEGHAITAASAVLMTSDIPWSGPLAGVLVGRIDGKFIADPDAENREKSDLDLLVAGSSDAIAMIEGSAKEYTNEEMILALEFAHKSIKSKLNIQTKLAKSASIKKREVSLRLPEKKFIEEIRDFASEKMKQANQPKLKEERANEVRHVYKETVSHFETLLKEKGTDDWKEQILFVKEELHNIEYLAVRSLIFEKGMRSDGRKLDEIRDITVEMDPLPGAHGSAVFTRGQTQSLGVVTLGTRMDNQRYESLDGQKTKNFMLHYNFPPFSTGEVKRMMGPGRREIGHGNLAYRSLKQVLPNQDDFPYVIRVVSEILESNGSSSMASVCSGSLAMMGAGIPLSGPVSGIAMGLMSDDKGNTAILSDIAGIEDHFGDMDLKIAGTEKGITAFQLDLKVTGIDLKILQKSLKQAEEGRMYILNEMNKVLPNSRATIPEGAPRIHTIQIDSSRIGEMIGPGGKIIRDIIERSGAEVNVEDSGVVTIASTSAEANQKAQQMIENIFREIEEGSEYEGVIKRIVEFGAFIEIYPGKEGLLHISKMSNSRIASVNELYKLGDKVPVIVLGIDRMGRIDLCHRDVESSTNRKSQGSESDQDEKRTHTFRRSGQATNHPASRNEGRNNDRNDSRSDSDRKGKRNFSHRGDKKEN